MGRKQNTFFAMGCKGGVLLRDTVNNSLLPWLHAPYFAIMVSFPAISEVVKTQLLPWTTSYAPKRLIVAQPRLQQMKATTDLPLVPKKLKGPRKSVRSFTLSGLSARWPNDELVETDCPILVLVLKGEAQMNCGDYVFHAPQGHAVFIPGRVPRWTGVEELEYLGDNPDRFCETILFRETCGSLEVWLSFQHGNRQYRSGPNEVLVVHNIRLIRLLEEIQEEVTEQRTDFETMSWRLLEFFILSLQRDLREDKAIYPARLTEGDIALQDRNAPIQRAQQYVREHLHEELTQDVVARRVYLSRTQFISRFQEETGQTFNQFVTHCRIEQAKILLHQTDFPLTFIHHSVGYKSPTYFNTVFRKQTGMLPSKFRFLKKTYKDGA